MNKGASIARQAGCVAFSKCKQAFVHIDYRRGKSPYHFLVIKYKGIDRARLPPEQRESSVPCRPGHPAHLKGFPRPRVLPWRRSVRVEARHATGQHSGEIVFKDDEEVRWDGTITKRGRRLYKASSSTSSCTTTRSVCTRRSITIPPWITSEEAHKET